METANPNGGKRRGFFRWRRIALLALLSIPLLFLLGNLALTNPWTRRWVCGKIERRTGLQAGMASLTWSPWAGISAGRFELLQPAPLREAVDSPLVSVKSVRMNPPWRAWLRGRPEIGTVELDTPRVVLPVELLSHLARTAPPPAVAPPQPPAIAAMTPPAPQGPAATPPPASPGPAQPGPPTAPGGTPVPKPAPPPAPPVVTTPTIWLKMNDASFSLVLAAKKRVLLEGTGITGSLPIAGREAESRLETGPVKVLGETLSPGFHAGFEWKFPFLSLRPVETTIRGCKATLSAKAASIGGFPVQVEWRMPRQKPEEIATPFGGRASMESLASEGRFLGLMLSPASWTGEFVAEAISPSVALPSMTTRFDRARMVTLLRGGVLSCVDARVTGDEGSLLGNATLLPDGRLAAAARIVATPQGAIHAARMMFPDLPGEPSLTPLSTPQRVAFDLEAIGNIGQVFLRLGKDGPVVEIKP